MPTNCIVLADPSGAAFFNIHYLKISSGARVVCCKLIFFVGMAHYAELNWASMGEMTAGAVGVAVANKTTPVFSIVGDGCFAMAGMEVSTAVQYGLKVVNLF